MLKEKKTEKRKRFENVPHRESSLSINNTYGLFQTERGMKTSAVWTVVSAWGWWDTGGQSENHMLSGTRREESPGRTVTHTSASFSSSSVMIGWLSSSDVVLFWDAKKNPKTKPKRLELMWKHVKEENSAQIYQGYPQQPLPDAGGHCRFSGDEMKTSRCLWPEMIID